MNIQNFLLNWILNWMIFLALFNVWMNNQNLSPRAIMNNFMLRRAQKCIKNISKTHSGRLVIIFLESRFSIFGTLIGIFWSSVLCWEKKDLLQSLESWLLLCGGEGEKPSVSASSEMLLIHPWAQSLGTIWWLLHCSTTAGGGFKTGSFCKFKSGLRFGIICLVYVSVDLGSGTQLSLNCCD